MKYIFGTSRDACAHEFVVAPSAPQGRPWVHTASSVYRLAAEPCSAAHALLPGSEAFFRGAKCEGEGELDETNGLPCCDRAVFLAWLWVRGTARRREHAPAPLQSMVGPRPAALPGGPSLPESAAADCTPGGRTEPALLGATCAPHGEQRCVAPRTSLSAPPTRPFQWPAGGLFA